MTDIVKRLRDTPNWMREGFQDWKDNVRTYDSAPFEAADRIEELEAEVAKARDRIAEPGVKLAKAVEALEEIATDEHPLGWVAITALTELKGEE